MMEVNKVSKGTEFAYAGLRKRLVAETEPAHSERSASCSKPRPSMFACLMVCFSDFSLWFSLPLSVWLSSGWIGLIFHWQAIRSLSRWPAL
jgi:hypothetical protein